MKNVFASVVCSPITMLAAGLATSMVCTGIATIVTAVKSKPTN